MAPVLAINKDGGFKKLDNEKIKTRIASSGPDIRLVDDIGLLRAALANTDVGSSIPRRSSHGDLDKQPFG